jgi:arabinogalactan oligomer/maltooligosaccharide transport system permease protein
VLHILALLACYIAIYPALWILGTSLQSAGIIFFEHPRITDILIPFPSAPSFISYGVTFLRTPYLRWMLNSILVGLATVGLALAVAAPAGYALSRFRFKGRTKILWGLMLLNALPGLVTFIPIFTLLLTWGRLLNAPTLLLSIYGLIIVYSAGAIPYSTWLLKTFFDTIPYDLDEAASVDGAGASTIFFRVISPLALPGLATVAILILIGVWGEWLLASIVVQSSSQYTLPVGIISWSDPRWAPSPSMPVFAAASLIASLPILVVFAISQRYLRAGLTMGAVKG